MPLRMWLIVLAVALIGVMFGLDWQSASVTPRRAVSTAPSVVEPLAPQISPDAVQAESSNAPFIPNDDSQPRNAPSPRAQASDERAPRCNVRACEEAYRSFRASDCTYQPSQGERRLCTKQ